ncbi:MAG: PEGA domain-containing protein [Bacteroidetes bacterium]|nr:MAG: PEGA domain-containing protein [Bacteroidota bacterium]
MRQFKRAFLLCSVLLAVLQAAPAEADTASVQQCILVVESQPPHAAVEVNGALRGQTPLHLAISEDDTITLAISLDRYVPYATPVYPMGRDTVRVFRRLLSKYAYIDFRITPPDAAISVDGVEIHPASGAPVPVLTGERLLSASHPSFTNALQSTVSFRSDERWSVIGDFDKPSYDLLEYSLLLPGSGQMMDGSSEKGVAIMAAAGLTVAGMISSEGVFMYHFLRYRSENDKLKNANAEQEQLRIAASARSSYDAAQNAVVLRNAFAAGFAAVYVLNILDILLFHTQRHTFDLEPSFEPSSGRSMNAVLLTVRGSI